MGESPRRGLAGSPKMFEAGQIGYPGLAIVRRRPARRLRPTSDAIEWKGMVCT